MTTVTIEALRRSYKADKTRAHDLAKEDNRHTLTIGSTLVQYNLFKTTVQRIERDVKGKIISREKAVR